MCYTIVPYLKKTIDRDLSRSLSIIKSIECSAYRKNAAAS